MYTLANILKLR